MELRELGALLCAAKNMPKKWTGRDIPKEETALTLKEAWLASNDILESLEIIRDNISKKSRTPYVFKISDAIEKCQDAIVELMGAIRAARPQNDTVKHDKRTQMLQK